MGRRKNVQLDLTHGEALIIQEGTEVIATIYQHLSK
jgi:hypothetical protein